MHVRAWSVTVVLVAVAVIASAGCSSPSTPTTAPAPTPTTTGPTTTTTTTTVAATVPPATAPISPPTGLAIGDVASPMPAPNTCTLRGVGDQSLPDPACTPGTVNSAVTPDTITSTICKTGWTATVRPPVSQTNKMKAQSARSYSIAATTTGEYDHLVALQLGGATADPRNLWFEPGPIPNPKDAVETKLNLAVCSALITLTAAQNAIATDWTTALDVTGITAVGTKTCLRTQPTRCTTTGARG